MVAAVNSNLGFSTVRNAVTEVQVYRSRFKSSV